MHSHKFRSSIAQFLITMLATVAFDLTIAILIGVSISILLFVVKIANVEIETSDVDHERLNHSNDIEHEKLKSIKVCYITGPIFFGSVNQLEKEVTQLNDYKVLIFSMRGVPMIDAGAAHTMLETIAHLNQKGITVMFSGLQSSPKTVLNRAGVVSLVGEENFYWDAQQAIESRL